MKIETRIQALVQLGPKEKGTLDVSFVGKDVEECWLASDHAVKLTPLDDGVGSGLASGGESESDNSVTLEANDVLTKCRWKDHVSGLVIENLSDQPAQVHVRLLVSVKR